MLKLVKYIYRDINSLSPENCEFPFSPPRTEENWENETQDITPPYGKKIPTNIPPISI